MPPEAFNLALGAIVAEADPPKLKLFAPVVNVPDVKVNTPLMVGAPLKLIELPVPGTISIFCKIAPLIVLPLPVILIFPAPVCLPVPVIFPVTEIVLPPSANVPLVKAKEPDKVIPELAFKVAGVPFVLLSVKLFNAVILEGIANGPALVPPKDKFEEDVVVKLVAVPAIAAPFKFKVFAPTVNVPVVKVRVPFTVGEPDKLKPPLLFNYMF